MRDSAARQMIIASACAMHSDGLTVANSGNISVRREQGFLITPSGVPYESLTPDQIVHLDDEGGHLSGKHKPSSEWRIHKDIYTFRPQTRAIVHAHAPHATALSVTRQALPAFHYMVALFGGHEVPCAAYATFGTQALSAHVITALRHHNACLMANHGMISTADSLPLAYQRALELESLCQQYLLARQAGEVHLLSADEMAEAGAAFAVYGPEPDKS